MDDDISNYKSISSKIYACFHNAMEVLWGLLLFYYKNLEEMGGRSMTDLISDRKFLITLVLLMIAIFLTTVGTRWERFSVSLVFLLILFGFFNGAFDSIGNYFNLAEKAPDKGVVAGSKDEMHRATHYISGILALVLSVIIFCFYSIARFLALSGILFYIFNAVYKHFYPITDFSKYFIFIGLLILSFFLYKFFSMVIKFCFSVFFSLYGMSFVFLTVCHLLKKLKEAMDCLQRIFDMKTSKHIVVDRFSSSFGVLFLFGIFIQTFTSK